MGFVSDVFGVGRISMWIGRFAQWLSVDSIAISKLPSREEATLSCGVVPKPRESQRAVLTNR